MSNIEIWSFGALQNTCNWTHLPLSNVLEQQVAADVKGDFLYNYLYILIISKWQIHTDDLSRLNFRW